MIPLSFNIYIIFEYSGCVRSRRLCILIQIYRRCHGHWLAGIVDRHRHVHIKLHFGRYCGFRIGDRRHFVCHNKRDCSGRLPNQMCIRDSPWPSA